MNEPHLSEGLAGLRDELHTHLTEELKRLKTSLNLQLDCIKIEALERAKSFVLSSSSTSRVAQLEKELKDSQIAVESQDAEISRWKRRAEEWKAEKISLMKSVSTTASKGGRFDVIGAVQDARDECEMEFKALNAGFERQVLEETKQAREAIANAEKKAEEVVTERMRSKVEREMRAALLQRLKPIVMKQLEAQFKKEHQANLNRLAVENEAHVSKLEKQLRRRLTEELMAQEQDLISARVKEQLEQRVKERLVLLRKDVEAEFEARVEGAVRERLSAVRAAEHTKVQKKRANFSSSSNDTALRRAKQQALSAVKEKDRALVKMRSAEKEVSGLKQQLQRLKQALDATQRPPSPPPSPDGTIPPIGPSTLPTDAELRNILRERGVDWTPTPAEKAMQMLEYVSEEFHRPAHTTDMSPVPEALDETDVTEGWQSDILPVRNPIEEQRGVFRCLPRLVQQVSGSIRDDREQKSLQRLLQLWEAEAARPDHCERILTDMLDALHSHSPIVRMLAAEIKASSARVQLLSEEQSALNRMCLQLERKIASIPVEQRAVSLARAVTLLGRDVEEFEERFQTRFSLWGVPSYAAALSRIR